MQKQWHIAAHDVGQIEDFQHRTGLPALVAHMLLARGIRDADAVQAFLEPKLTQLRDPFDLPGVRDAVTILRSALDQRQRIVIFGDYDADGITGTAILSDCLRLLDANVGTYIPCRLEEGYGLNDDALRKLAAEKTTVVVTVDCGIASVESAQTARELGLRLIITDHHTMADRLPDAEAIVHPKLPDTDYPFHGLCGAGVAFKLAWALCQDVCQSKRVTPPMREFLLRAVGLAAIGTVADIVPLLDENRALVHYGLGSLPQHRSIGLAQLMQRTKLDQKPSLGSEDIGFTIAPRLNAAGRLGQAALALELLTTTKPDRAAALAEYIDELNKTRGTLERSVYLAANKQAIAMLESDPDAALVLAGHGWHVGVIGIVAGRLAEKYHRPVLVIGLDESGVKPGVGSGRSIPGVDLVEALAGCREHLIAHGGHAAAAGFRLQESSIDAFRHAFCEQIAASTPQESSTARLSIDAEIPFAALTLGAVEQIERLAPFGQANRRPLLCTSGVTLAAPPKPMGGGGRHLALQLAQHETRLRGVVFGGGDWADALSEADGTLSFAFRPVINAFAGRRTVEIHVVDWKADASPSARPAPTAEVAS